MKKSVNDQITEIHQKMNDPDLCKGTADCVTRVSGYYRSVSNFNIGKAEEFRNRLSYKIS